MADRILAGTEALADALARTSSRPPAVAAAAARLAGRRVRTRRRTVRVAVPLLAAASLVVLLARSPAKPAISPAQPDRAALPPIVEAGGQHVAVFTTHRPDIVVVWQF